MNMNITLTFMKLTTVTTMSCSDGYPPLQDFKFYVDVDVVVSDLLGISQ